MENVSEYQFQMPFKRQSTSGKSALENFFVCSAGRKCGMRTRKSKYSTRFSLSSNAI